MRVSLVDNFQSVIQRLDRRARDQVPFAAAKTLTDIAKAAQAEIPTALERSLSQPKPYTKRGTFVSAARKHNLVSTVGFKDRQARYMALQISGGVRKRKRFEERLVEAGGRIAVPAKGVRLDQYGNVTKAQLLQIAKGVRGEGKGRAKQFFVGRPGGRRGEEPTGIYARVDGGKRVVPVMLFAQRARYRRRFNFVGLVQRVSTRLFAQTFERNLQVALASAR